MQEYVAGFLFDDDGSNVALVLKNRPVWQAGRFNAIGGKVELGETPIEAMRREFYEEAGVDSSWRYRFALVGNHFTVHFFDQYSSLALSQVYSKTDEAILIQSTSSLPNNIIPNLKWIIPMIQDPTIRIPEVIEDIGGS